MKTDTNKTAIEWTHRPGTIGATWNPWYGCKKKSAGCKNCYMYREQLRYRPDGDPSIVMRSASTFRKPLSWKEPHTIFTCSWSDWFNPEADEWRGEAWDIIRRTPQHTYIILTKLPERIADHLPDDWITDEHPRGYPNVWLCVSAENQEMWNKRAEHLTKIPAVVRGISAEPLLGEIDLRQPKLETPNGWMFAVDAYQWILIGGESDENPRVMQPEWAESLIHQAIDNKLAIQFKQWGGTPRNKRGGSEALILGRLWREFPKVDVHNSTQNLFEFDADNTP